MSNIYGTYASKIFVQQLYISVDDLQGDKFIILILYSTAEIQAGISKPETVFNIKVNKIGLAKINFLKGY